jgi:hypothetical protein
MGGIWHGQQNIGGTGYQRPVVNFLPGSSVIVDGQRSIDAQVGNLLGRGQGRVGKAFRTATGRPPIRPGINPANTTEV